MSSNGQTCRVVLMGMMGSGKSTVGRELARLTGWPYHDNDELLQRALGMTARELLGTRGESALRAAESEALNLGLRQPAPCIVSAPAGTILEAPVRDLTRSRALVVWLRARPGVLASRAIGAAHRPWLDGDAVHWMTVALDQRGPLYEAISDLIVDTDTLQPGAVATKIAGWLAGVGACPDPTVLRALGPR